MTRLMVAFISLVLTSSIGFSQDMSLKDDMKAIGDLFKSISKSVNDSSQNQINAQRALQVETLFAAAGAKTPDSIGTMPADQQVSALALFQSLVKKEVDLAANLADAFQKGDNATVMADLDQMAQIKKQGHDTFNPPKP